MIYSDEDSTSSSETEDIEMSRTGGSTTLRIGNFNETYD